MPAAREYIIAALTLFCVACATDAEDYGGVVWTTAVYENALVETQVLDGSQRRIDVGISPIGLLHDQVTNQLFSTTHGSAELWVVDRSTGDTDAVIPVGGLPYWLAMSSEREVFVANSGDGTISVIDPDNLVEKRRMTVAGSPIAFELDEQKRGLYFVDYLGDRVVFASWDDGSTLWQSSEVKLPIWVTPETNSNRLFVAESRENNVVILDRSDGSLIDRFAAGETPTGLFVFPRSRRLAVLNHTSDVIEIFDTETLAPIRSLIVGDNPVGGIIGGDGRTLLVSLSGANKLGFLDVEKMEMRLTLDVGDGPRGIVWLE